MRPKGQGVRRDPSHCTSVGETLYMANGVNGLLVYNSSETWNDLPQLGYYILAGSVTAAAGPDAYACIINEANTRVVDAADRSAPVPAGIYTPAP
jgi:hypothetical protein